VNPAPPPVKPRRIVRRFSLSEKIAIVRESMAPGITASSVARRHGLAVNVLYYWRRAYRDIVDADLTAGRGDTSDAESAELRQQVRNLERLLGQRALEIALLRDRLGKASDDGVL
jgi:transposase